MLINFQANHTKHNTQSRLGQIASVQRGLHEEAVDSRSETIEDVNEEIELKDKKRPFKLID